MYTKKNSLAIAIPKTKKKKETKVSHIYQFSPNADLGLPRPLLKQVALADCL